MNFDDRFLGLMNMLGGMNGKNQSPSPSGQGQAMGIEDIMKFMGLMQGFQSGMSRNAEQSAQNNDANINPTQSAKSNGMGGVDIMKILPLLSILKGGNPFSTNNFPTSINQQNYTENINLTGQNQINNVNFNTEKEYDKKVQSQIEKQGGYKDKYSTISFAGNEVIYTLGKLWKTRIQ